MTGAKTKRRYRIQTLWFGEWKDDPTYGPYTDLSVARRMAKEKLSVFSWRIVDDDGDVYDRGNVP